MVFIHSENVVWRHCKDRMSQTSFSILQRRFIYLDLGVPQAIAHVYKWKRLLIFSCSTRLSWDALVFARADQQTSPKQMDKETVLGSMLTQTEPVFCFYVFCFLQVGANPKGNASCIPKAVFKISDSYSLTALYVGNLQLCHACWQSTILMALYDGNRRSS